MAIDLRQSFGGPRRSDLIVPGIATVVAGAADALGSPWWAAAPLSCLSAVLVLERLVRRRDRSLLDSVVRGTGGMFVVLIAIGFVLDVVPGGLTRLSWSIGASIAGLGALIIQTRRSPPPPLRMAFIWRTTGAAWYALAAAGLGISLVISIRATTQSERPVLALSLESSDNDSAELTITAGAAGGEYDLLLDNGRTPVTVHGPIGMLPYSSVEDIIALPAGNRVTVSLVAHGHSQALRSLIVNGSSSPIG